MKLTVAICTWNRASLLDQTLSEMSRMRIPEGVEWELLIVNNNCTDRTDEVIERHAESLPIRRLFEKNPGLSHARNRAVAEAQGEIILWTDDDVLVDPDWLATYVDAFRTWPDAAFFGGTVAPLFSVEPPEWIGRNLEVIRNVYSIKQLGASVRPIDPEEYPVGANMAIRRTALRLDAFDTRIGVCENHRFGGEENKLVDELRVGGGYGVWVGPARVRHNIPAERLTTRYVRGWFNDQGRRFVREGHLPDCPSFLGAPRWVLRRCFEERLKALLFAPFHSGIWLRAFVQAAYYAGILQEKRQQDRDRSLVPTASSSRLA